MAKHDMIKLEKCGIFQPTAVSHIQLSRRAVIEVHQQPGSCSGFSWLEERKAIAPCTSCFLLTMNEHGK